MTDLSQAGDPRTRLVAFLVARLEDDEAAAQTAIASRDILAVTTIEQISDHSARHGPIRVLREVAAKRAMVQMWLDGIQAQPSVPGLDVAEAMIMALLAVYADHPDFRSAWLASDGREPIPDQARDAGGRPDEVITSVGR